VHREQALVAAHAVIDVHDRRADRELGEIADDRFRIARGAAATLAVALAAHPLAVQLALGEHGERGLVSAKPCSRLAMVMANFICSWLLICSSFRRRPESSACNGGVTGSRLSPG